VFVDSRRDYQPQQLPDLKVPGVVLQRFPSSDRKDTPLPSGIELVSLTVTSVTSVHVLDGCLSTVSPEPRCCVDRTLVTSGAVPTPNSSEYGLIYNIL